MRVAIIAPPFIAVPPARYGGTELFIAQLATGLSERGHEVVVYANGESQLPCEVRWLYEASEWPLADPATGSLKTLVHTSWAMHDLGGGFDIVHLNDAMATAFTPFVSMPAVKTLHHPHEPSLSAMYARYPGDHLRRDLRVPGAAALDAAASHDPPRCAGGGLHGSSGAKRDYLVFLGRIAPAKGTHLAIRGRPPDGNAAENRGRDSARCSASTGIARWRRTWTAATSNT